MSLDFDWGLPSTGPETDHAYAEGSTWRSPHPEVFSRVLRPQASQVWWIYWCPRTGREGAIKFDGSPRRKRAIKESWLIGKVPYGTGDWYGMHDETAAVQVLCELLTASEDD